MSVERVYHCDGPECAKHARTASPTRLPVSFLLVSGEGEPDQHFCSWDCTMRFAAAKEPTETYSADSSPSS